MGSDSGETAGSAMTDTATDLREAFVNILEAVGGGGSVREVGYLPLSLPGSHRIAEHRLYAIVDPQVRPAVLGRDGSNMHRVRGLLKTRLLVLDLPEREEIDARVIEHRSEAPAGTTWGKA